MGKLIRLDSSGHTTLAEWTAADEGSTAAAAGELARELDRGMIASVSHADGTAEVVRELPAEGLVVLRRQIAGG